MVVTHTFNPSTWKEQRQADLCELEASLFLTEQSELLHRETLSLKTKQNEMK